MRNELLETFAMSTDKIESQADVWDARFDDRDDEDLAWQVWAQRLAAREQAMAQPIRNFTLPEAANEDKPSAE